MNQRITYIDNLRAFGIFCVICSHVYTFSLPSMESPVAGFIKLFFMPLFFYISGIFAKETNSTEKITRRSFKLIVPTIIWGIIFCIYQKTPLTNLLFTNHHWGFWFLPTLLVITLLWNLRTYMVNTVNLFSKNKICFDIVFVLVCTLLIVGAEHILDPKISCLLFTSGSKKYLIYYWGGHYIHKWINNDNSWGYTILFVCSALGSVLILNNIVHNVIMRYIVSFCIISSLDYMFSHINMDSKVLRFVGKNTMEIYLLHFFFIPRKLSGFLNYDLLLSNFVLDISVVCIISSIVLLFTAILIWIIKCNKKSDIIFFGNI